MVKRKTQEEFIGDVFDLVGDEYTVMGTYTRTKDKILMRHNVCGNSWMITPNNFLRGKSCPDCAYFKHTPVFREEVQEIYGNTLEVLGEYVNCGTHIELRCKEHGIKFRSTPTNVLRGRNVCPMCNADYLSKVQRKTEDTFQEELKERHDGRIVSLEKYINTHTKIEFMCTECSKTFEAEPNSVLRISGCPNCRIPKGELAIERYLRERGISFTPQKTFPDCRHVRPLPFDFYLPEYNLLIEYDGKQHYTPIEFFGGKKEFEYQAIRDGIKNEYANEQNIVLLRIPYTVTGSSLEILLDEYLGIGSPKCLVK